MKNFSVNTFGFITASLTVAGLAFFVQACGGGNNTPPIPPASRGACVGASCPGAVNANAIAKMNPLALLDTQLTGNKALEYAELCLGTFENVRHIVINGVNVCRFVLSGNVEESINEGAILTPDSTSGGLDTGIHLFSGDSLELSSQGRYSHRKPNVWHEALMSRLSGCHNEISTEGSMIDEEGEDSITLNAANDQPAGFYVALSNGHSFVAEPIAVGREQKTLSSTGPEDLFVGYNTDRIECGNIKLRYHVIRCLDANLNTYPCPKE
jgi:hypothetical protein